LPVYLEACGISGGHHDSPFVKKKHGLYLYPVLFYGLMPLHLGSGIAALP